MATELARALPAEELIEKGICPIKKEYIVDENVALVRKHVAAVGSVVAKQPPQAQSNTQRKKVPHPTSHPRQLKATSSS